MLGGVDEHVNLHEEAKYMKITQVSSEKRLFQSKREPIFLKCCHRYHLASGSIFCFYDTPTKNKKLFLSNSVSQTDTICADKNPLRDSVCFVCFVLDTGCFPPAISLIFMDVLMVLEMDRCDSIRRYLPK